MRLDQSNYLKVNQTIQQTTQFSVLSDDQIEQIYFAALEVLETTGARVLHERAIELFRGSDAVVTDETLVRLPASLVQRALGSNPRKITLAGRNRHRSVKLQPNAAYFGTGSDLPFTYDRKTGERRRCTRADVGDFARVVDALDQYDFHMSHGIVGDAPNPRTYDRHQFLAMLETCTKPMVLTTVDGEGLEDLWRMACMVCGGADELRLSPLFVVYIEPISPLNNDRTAMEKLLFAAEKGIPAMYTPCPSSGATAPATMAGMLVQSLAETLLAVALCHLAKPGMPLIMGGVTTVMDMATSSYSYGAPELSLVSAANTDISRWLGLPMFSTGGCTDAKVLDEQAATEMTTSLLYAQLSGANLIHDVGYMDCGTLATPEALVLCQELVGMVRAFGRGINTDDDHLALDLIDKVGPGGEFLTHDHTFDYWREWFLPKLQDRTDWETWLAEGEKTMLDRVVEETDRLLTTYEPEPLDEGLLTELKSIAAAADARHS